MISTLHYLNQKNCSNVQLLLILKHIRENCNIIFNVRAFYVLLRKCQYDPALVKIKSRDYMLSEKKKFKTTTDFLIALSTAKRLVSNGYNLENLQDLLEERIGNDDYAFMDEIKFCGRRGNNEISYAVLNKFNILATGRLRKPRHGLKNNLLYTNPIKGVTIKSMLVNVNQQNAHFKRATLKYEKELKAFNALINNREIIKQLYLIVCDINNNEPTIKITKDDEVQENLKSELLITIDKTEVLNVALNAIEFDKNFLKKKNNLPEYNGTEDLYDAEMRHSVFNQLSTEQANSLGEQFFQEYLKFHDNNVVKEIKPKIRKVKEMYIMPEIDFDASN